MSSAVLERIHQVLGNLVRTFNIQQTYVDKNYPWTGILAAAAFAIFSTTNRPKGYSPGQLIFGCDMIIQIKHRVDWELIRHQKQTQIIRDNARENKHIFEYDYKFGYKFMLTNHTAYKYEMTYKVHFAIKHCFTNRTVILQYVVTQIQYNIRRIKLYKSDTKVEYFNSKNMSDDVNICGYT